MPTPDSLELPVINPRPRRNPRAESIGRSMGTVNRITRDLKSGIVDAAAAHGSDGQGTGGLTGYLYWLAGQHPRSFSGLLGKLLPMQVSGHVAATVAAVNVVSVPVDRYMTQDEVRKITGNGPVIDNEPNEAA